MRGVDRITITAGKPGGPVIITDPDNANFLALQMPITQPRSSGSNRVIFYRQRPRGRNSFEQADTHFEPPAHGSPAFQSKSARRLRRWKHENILAQAS